MMREAEKVARGREKENEKREGKEGWGWWWRGGMGMGDKKTDLRCRSVWGCKFAFVKLGGLRWLAERVSVLRFILRRTCVQRGL